MLQKFRTISSRLWDSMLSLSEIRNTFSISLCSFLSHSTKKLGYLFFQCYSLYITKNKCMHIQSTNTEFNSGKGQAPTPNFNATPRPMGKGCWGGGSRWSFSEQLRPVSAPRALKMSLNPGSFPKGCYVHSPTNNLSTLVFGISHDRCLSLGQGQSTGKSEIPQKNEAKQSFKIETCNRNTPQSSLCTHISFLCDTYTDTSTENISVIFSLYLTWDRHQIDKNFKIEFSTHFVKVNM